MLVTVEASSGDLALSWGRSLYGRLRAHGLVNLGMKGATGQYGKGSQKGRAWLGRISSRF